MLQYGFNTIINHQFGMVITIILWQGSGLVSYFYHQWTIPVHERPIVLLHSPLTSPMNIHSPSPKGQLKPTWLGRHGTWSWHLLASYPPCPAPGRVAPHRSGQVLFIRSQPGPGPRRQWQGGDLRKPSPFGKKSTKTTVSFVFFRSWHQQEPHATWIKTWIPFAKGRITWQHALLDPIGTWTLSKDGR